MLLSYIKVIGRKKFGRFLHSKNHIMDKMCSNLKCMVKTLNWKPEVKIPAMRVVHAFLLFAATFVSYLTRNNINMAVLKMTEGSEERCNGTHKLYDRKYFLENKVLGSN